MSDGIMDGVPSADYVRIDGKVFAITPIASDEVDIEAELKAYLNEKYIKHIEEFNGGIVAGMTDDWDQQIRKLTDYSRRTNVSLGRNDLNKPVICTDGRSIEHIKVIIYSPHRFKMTNRDIGDTLGIDYERGTDDRGRTTITYGDELELKDGTKVDLNAYPSDQPLFVHVERRIFLPAIYSFNSRSDRLNCINLQTFHSQSTSICTGSHRASAFWADPNFAERMNEINCFSLGNRHVRLRDGGDRQEYGLESYIKRDTIISIAPEGGGQWRT